MAIDRISFSLWVSLSQRRCHSLILTLRMCFLLLMPCIKKKLEEMEHRRLHCISRKVMENYSAFQNPQCHWLWLHNSNLTWLAYQFLKEEIWICSVAQVLSICVGPCLGYDLLFGPLWQAKTERMPYVDREVDRRLQFLCVCARSLEG